MQERSLVTSASAERRLAAAVEWLATTADLAGILVVGPSRGAVDDLLRHGVAGRGGLLAVHRASPGRLAVELATPVLAERRLAPVGGLALEALAARAIAAVSGRGELVYFAPVADAPGLPGALAKTLGELRRGAISPAELATSGEPGRDLANLLAAYQDELQARRLADPAAVLALAAADGRPHRWLGLPLLLLDVSPTTVLERRLLARVAAASSRVLATAPAGDDEGIAGLAEVLATPAVDLDAGARATSRLERLRRSVFVPEPIDPAVEGAAPPADDDSVVFLAAPGEGRECVELARRARELAAEGVGFDRMAILLRDPDRYLPLVEEALARAAIPAYVSHGAVRPDPAGRALLALLACAAEGLSASRFAEYLSLAQVPELDAAGAPPLREVPWVEPEGDQLVLRSLVPALVPAPPGEEPTAPGSPVVAGDDDPASTPVVEGGLRAPYRWERLLVDAAVVGKSRWKPRLEGLREELELRRGRLGDDREDERERLGRTLAELGVLSRFALPVVEQLAALPERALWGGWLDALESLAARVLRAPKGVLAALAELRAMDGVGPVGLDEVRRVLEERLRFLRVEPPERRAGRLFVGTLAEARGRSFEVVLLPGLAEGIFPRRATEDPLLLDAVRARLSAALPCQDQRVARERLLLRIAAGAARRRLVVSYPGVDPVEGRARVPSFYALDVLRATEGSLPALRGLQARAAAGTDALLGWPAPRLPERAIDDAEFDLAVLGPLLADPAGAAGRARFLVAASETLARSLRARWQRWSRSFGAADGLVSPDAGAAEALAARRLDRRGYSPTSLQRWAACPYQFHLGSVMRLRRRDETGAAPLEQLDPLTRGSLFHVLQYEVQRALGERGLLPVRDAVLAAARSLADEVFATFERHQHDRLAPAIERVWKSEMETLRIDLQGWLGALARADDGFEPLHAELSFGLDEVAEDRPDRDPSGPRGEAVVAGGFRLRGAIDLVEVDPTRGVLRVTDHKTGKPYGRAQLVVGGGEVLQPLLYALAAERLLERPVESGRLFFCTRRGGYETRAVTLDDGSRAKIAAVLGQVDRALADGFLPATPRPTDAGKAGACQYCDFRPVCGPLEEVRSARKRPQLLEPLAQVRRMP